MEVLELSEATELTPLSEFKKRDAALAELAATHRDLKIVGIEDKAGYEKCHKAQMELRKVRVSIETTRKELKAGAIEYGKKVDAEAARLTAIVEPVENELAREKEKVDEEKERRRQAAVESMRARVRQRMDEFRTINILPPFGYEDMTDDDYGVALASARLEAAKREQAAAEEKRRQDEIAEQQRREREELGRLRAEQEAERQRIEAERQKLDNERAEQERAKEREVFAKQAAERAAKETEERIARETAQAAQREALRQAELKAESERIEAERIKAEAEKPLREKILQVAAMVEQVPVYLTGDVEAKVKKAIATAVTAIRKLANGPLE